MKKKMNDEERKTYAVNAPHSLYPFRRTADLRLCGAVGNRPCISTQDLGLIVLNVDFQPFLCVSSSCTLCLRGTLSSFQVEISKLGASATLTSLTLPFAGWLFSAFRSVSSAIQTACRHYKWSGRMFGRHYGNFCSGSVSCVSHLPTPPPILPLILSTNWGKQLCSVGLAKKFF